MTEGNQLLAIDAGSVTVSVVRVSAEGEILASGYRFHHGDVEQVVRAMLAEIGLEGVGAVAATSSTPALVRADRRYDNQIAFIEAARNRYPDLEGLLVVGGERFFFCRFDGAGRYLGSTYNTSCAAGTGSFLDQQASRLKMAGIEELCGVACRNTGRCPKIASRCAVFAKTDLIHAQQEGYGFAEISDGLCRGLARNIVDTLFAAERPAAEILFCGGVAKNEAVARHIEELAGCALLVPPDGHLFGAYGAALCLLAEVPRPHWRRVGAAVDVLGRAEGNRHYAYPPLQLQRSSYPDFSSLERSLRRGDGNNPVEVDIYEPMQGELGVFLGIDIGSTSTKAVLTDGEDRVMVGLYTRTAGKPLAAVQQIFGVLAEIETEKGVRFDILACATTGSGRKFIGRIVGADAIIDEITAHARAAVQLDAGVDTIIEIGGQDAKFTTLRRGRVTSSTMNTVCAAGTGSFIEEQAARLGCGVEEYGRRAEAVRAPMASDRCTVFMERDINHYLTEGFSVDEVLAAALHAVRENYLLKVASERNIGETILFQGATAKNRPLVAAFEQRLGKEIKVSKFCHLTGALGAALLAREEEGAGGTRFRGLDLHAARIPISMEVCGLCANHCKLSVAELPSGKVAYGFLCGREYEDEGYVDKKGGSFDLLRERRRLAGSVTSAPLRGDPVIGLPAAVHMVDDLGLWQRFFAELGIRTRVSSGARRGVERGKKTSLAEFCAPVTAMHGHVEELLEKSDYVFLPMYLENKSREARRQYCYYTQFLPAVIATSLSGAEKRVLSPVLRYLYTSFHAKMQLYRMLKAIVEPAPGFLEVSSAYDRALEWQRSYRRELRRFQERQSRTAGDVEVVLLGRPYTVLSPALNCRIPDIFAELGVNAYFQDMLASEVPEGSRTAALLAEIHWQHSAAILAAAETVARRDNIYPVYVTSFKCSPDSFTVEYFKEVMEGHGKPYLVLELDEHDSSVGYETRIEAAVRAFRNHRAEQRKSRRAAPALPDLRGATAGYETDLRDKTILLPNWDRITCAFLAATLQREGYAAHVVQESEATIRRSLRHNTGQCIPLNAIAEGVAETVEALALEPARSVLWLNDSTIACNIKLYPHHIKSLLESMGLAGVGVYVGDFTLTDFSLRAAMNAYFSYMFGGLLRRVACSIRPYEKRRGETDAVLEESIALLASAFRGRCSKEEALEEVIGRFQGIATEWTRRPKVALFGDLYARDNRVMNQELIRFIEAHGGEVVTTPYSEYAKMIAGPYFRKWFNEGKYLDVLSNRAILATMVQLEKKYAALFDRILGHCQHSYADSPKEILAQYGVALENTGESMDNLLKIHYLKQQHPDVSLFVQTSPALCCPSLVTEAMRRKIHEKTGVPVVSIVYDGTGGQKNGAVVPYLRYGAGSNLPRRAGSVCQL